VREVEPEIGSQTWAAAQSQLASFNTFLNANMLPSGEAKNTSFVFTFGNYTLDASKIERVVINVNGADIGAVTSGNDGPIVTGGTYYGSVTEDGGPSNYLNPDAVSIPTDRTQPFGNAPRNVARGPSFKQFDLGLHKSFGLGRPGTRLEARIEAFNLFNTTNFSTPNGNRSATAFGTITSTFPARQLQLGVKFYF